MPLETENPDVTGPVCFEQMPASSYFYLDGGVSYSEKTEETGPAQEYLCTNKEMFKDKQDKALQYFVCPNNGLCTDGKVITPDYGKTVKFMKLMGLKELDRRDAIDTSNGAPNKC